FRSAAVCCDTGPCVSPRSTTLHFLPAHSCRPLQGSSFSLMSRPPPRSTLFPYTTLFRSIQLISNQTTMELKENLLFYQHVFLIRSEEHTSELQSRFDLVCRLLLEKKNQDVQAQTNDAVREPDYRGVPVIDQAERLARENQ